MTITATISKIHLFTEALIKEHHYGAVFFVDNSLRQSIPLNPTNHSRLPHRLHSAARLACLCRKTVEIDRGLECSMESERLCFQTHGGRGANRAPAILAHFVETEEGDYVIVVGGLRDEEPPHELSVQLSRLLPFALTTENTLDTQE